MKKLLFTLIFITALTLAQQAQAQETKEYVTIVYAGGYGYSISYPDGTIEDGKIANLYNHGKSAPALNEIFNKLAKKGYKLVSSSGGDGFSVYVFEK